MRRPVGLFLLALLLAGCLAGPSGCVPPTSARDVPADAPHEGGDGSVALRILVTDVNGTPLSGAPVAVHWNRDFIPEDEADPDVEIVVLRLRTDDGGLAVAHHPPDRYVVATAWYPNLTEEASPLLEPTDLDQEIDLRLLPTVFTWRAEGTFRGPSAVPTPFTEGENDLQGVSWGWLDGRTDRVTNMRVTAEWQGAFPDQGALRLLLDAHEPLSGDSRTERGEEAPAGAAGSSTWEGAWEWPVDMQVGLEAAQSGLTMAGVPYTIELAADVGGRDHLAARCGVYFADAPLQEATTPASTAASAWFIGLAVAAAVAVAATIGILVRKRSG